MLGTRHNSQEVISCEKPCLAAELGTPVRNQNLRFAHAPWIQENLPWKRIRRRILRRDGDRQVSKRHPCGLAAPAHMKEILLEWQQLEKGRTRERRLFPLEAGDEAIGPSCDGQIRHAASQISRAFRQRSSRRERSSRHGEASA